MQDTLEQEPLFKEKISRDVAMADIEHLMDRRKLFPRQRERMETAAEHLADAIQYGYVSVDRATGAITQVLDTPVGNMEQVVYKGRVEPMTLSRAMENGKAETQAARNLVYLSTYSGITQTEFKKMELLDRNNAEAIAYFL